MARWLPIAALCEGAGTTTWATSAGGFLLAVACVLAVAAVVTASCAVHLHFHRRDEKTADNPSNSQTRGSSGFKFAPKFPGRVLMNSRKKLLISKKWGRKEEEDDAELKAYDRAAMEEGGPGVDSVWQRNIMMGERCQPPDFSGIILYDVKGNRLPQFPQCSPQLNIFHASLDQTGFNSDNNKFTVAGGIRSPPSDRGAWPENIST